MRTAFRTEALDLLQELDAALLAMELDPGNAALVNRVFRAMHTVKGSGATAGFTHLAQFAHGVEEAFDLARAGKLAITAELIDCGLKACDVIREILGMEDDHREAPGERDVTEAVSRFLPAVHASATASPAASLATKLIAYTLIFRPHTGLFRTGTDPLSLLDELRDLGAATIAAHTNTLPSLDTLDPVDCHLWWTIHLVTDQSEATIRDVFLFVEDDCHIDIQPLPNQPGSIAFLLLSHKEQAESLRSLIDVSIKRMDVSTAEGISASMHTTQGLAEAAQWAHHHALAEAASTHTRILARTLRVAQGLSPQDALRLQTVLSTLHVQKERVACD